MAMIDVEDYEGWAIQLDPETGGFIGTKRTEQGYLSRDGRDIIRRKDMRDLKREIGRRSSGSLDLMYLGEMTVQRYDLEMVTNGLDWQIPARTQAPQVHTIISIEADRPRRKDGTLDHWRAYAVYDGKFIAGVLRFMERRTQALRALNEEFDAWVKGLGIHKLSTEEAKRLLQEARTSAKEGEATDAAE